MAYLTFGRKKYKVDNVVLTGATVAPRKKVISALKKRGIHVQSSVSGSTDLLIMGARPGKTKLSRALDLDVPMVFSEELTRSLGAGLLPKGEEPLGASLGALEPTKYTVVEPGFASKPGFKRTTKKRATKKRTSRAAAPAKKRTSKKRTSRRAAALKEFFWEDSDGRYGIVKASSKTDAERRIRARGKRGVKIRSRIPSWY